jgi:DNA-binding transcriptional ArsR family regulator
VSGESAAEDKRLNRLKLLDDHIGQQLRESERLGELKAAPSYGKPLDFGDGYDETPSELRMPMKVLKDAGAVPAEVEAMRELAALRQAAQDSSDAEESRRLLQKASELQQAISLRLERLRSGSL